MSITGSTATSGFIDLATFDEAEKYMYGGDDATAYFVRETRKATWFTQVPVNLSRASGMPDFGQDWSVQISRVGDYLLYAWLRVQIPSVTLDASTDPFSGNGRLRWTRNLMHNLIKDCAITFNDLIAEQFNNYTLDFWAAFTVPAGKINGYNNMIGNVDVLTQDTAPGVAIPAMTLNLPLPFFFARDSGVALPTAAIPYNDMRIQLSFRDYSDLLIVDSTNPAVQSVPAQASYLVDGAPSLVNSQVWGNYAIVSNEERRRMACAPRDILMEQFQVAPVQTFAPLTVPQPQYDIRFSHAIKVLFFAVRNKTNKAEWSNYTSASPIYDSGAINFTPGGAVDPIKSTQLIYESTQRLSAMGSDYYSLIQPFYHAPVIPVVTGLHMYAYSLDFVALDPMGSTNYGKLTNVSIIPEASAGAVTGAGGVSGGGSAVDGTYNAQKYEFITVAVNNNIIRISGGALGFPVL